MQYFIIFADPENVNLPVNSKIDFTKGISQLKRNNDRLIQKNSTGSVVFEIEDYINELTFSGILELPQHEFFDYIIQILKREVDDQKIIDDLTAALPKQKVNNLQQVPSSNKETKVKRQNTKQKVEKMGEKKIKTATLNKVAVACSIVTFLLLVFVIITQNNQINKLNNELTSVKLTQKNQTKVDVFIRYFLPKYYSNNKNEIFDYVTEKAYENITIKQGQVLSVIMQEFSQTSDNLYTTSYVLVITNGDTKKNIVLTIKLKENKKAKYGFEVISEPIEKNYQ